MAAPAPVIPAPPNEEPELAVPERYALTRELGRGGMGVVWLADDRRLGRPVAIKILPRALAGDAALHERFVREARVAASLAHPNVVPVYEVEEHAGQLLFVMGYVDGETLGARVERGGPLPLGEAVRALRDVAWALAYAHGRDVVHRDVKPDNVLVERGTGRALLVDFGIARAHHPGAGGGRGAAGLTRVGEVVGTPHFMSPEQATGDHVDARSDIYSLGVTAFTVLSGRVPFDGATTTAIIAQQLTAAPPDLAALRPDVPAELVAVVERCLAKDPAARFPDAHALADALDAIAAARPAVAPAIRAAETTTGQTLGFLVAVLAAGPPLAATVDWDADRVLAYFFVLVLAAMAPVRLVGVARGLARQGLPLDATRAGFRALAAERREAVLAMRAASGGARPGRQRALRLALGVVALLVVRYTQKTTAGLPAVGLARFALALVGVALVGVAVVQHLLRADRVASAGRLVRWLWLSPLGAGIFALAGRREARAPARPAPAPTAPRAPEAPGPPPGPVPNPVPSSRPDARAELREALELADRLRDALRRAVDGGR